MLIVGLVQRSTFVFTVSTRLLSTTAASHLASRRSSKAMPPKKAVRSLVTPPPLPLLLCLSLSYLAVVGSIRLTNERNEHTGSSREEDPVGSTGK